MYRLGFCSALCTLRLRGCTAVTDAGVALLTSKCGSALRQLDLARCGWGSTVSDLAVYAVPQQLLSHLLGTPDHATVAAVLRNPER